MILKNSQKTKPQQSVSTSISDNQIYPQVCVQACNDDNAFNNFRRNPIYNEVLEHVSQYQGTQYLQEISKDSNILSKINDFKSNDDYGNPRIYEYPNIGFFSPTTLRYIKVLTDIKKYFHTINNLDICEIGVGYGGQCRIINTYYKPNTYCLVDLQCALSLTKKFLNNYIIETPIIYKTMDELDNKKYDLVISNYAFTELTKSVQDIYLEKIILNSKMGYITYNEISSSYKLDELIKIIPKSKVYKEVPLTAPTNCIIMWGES